MAASGSFKTSNYNGRYLVFAWTATSQSVANNTTTISWTLKSAGEADWKYYKAGGFKVTIDGVTVYSVSTDDRITISEDTLIASGTRTITHNADGSGSFTAYAEGGIYYYAVNSTGSATFTLNTIPRKSTPTLSASTIELGKSVTIYTNRAHSSFTHKLYYGWYGAEWNLIASNVGASQAWTLPLTFANNIPDATQGWGTIRCETYNGSTLIGTADVAFTATVPASMKPTASIQVLDATDTKDTYGNLVKGLSTLRVNVTGTPSYNSAIVTYATTVEGVKYTGASITTKALQNAGTVTVTSTVTDKRGRTSTAATASFPVLDYAGPAITALTVRRCDQDGTANDQGEYAQVVFSASITPLNNKNSATYQLKYKKATTTSYTTVTLSALAGNYAVTNHEYIFAADSNAAYDVEVIAKDDLSSVARASKVSTAEVLMNWHPDGTALAIGKVSEESNTFEIAKNLHSYGHMRHEGNQYALSTAGTAGQAGYILMAHITIRKVDADTPITFVFSRRQAASPMQVSVRFKSSVIDPDLVSIVYEGDNYGAFLVKTAASEWDLYVEKGSAYDTIALQHWYTSHTMQDRTVITFPGTLVSELPDPFYRATPAKLRSLLDHIYPVNSIYISYSHQDPADLFGGTWERINNAFLWGTTSGGTIGQTGGESTHTLTIDEMPAHTHTATAYSIASGTLDTSEAKLAYKHNTGTNYVATTTWINSAGGGAAHNNMPPYIQVSIWRRTA